MLGGGIINKLGCDYGCKSPVITRWLQVPGLLKMMEVEVMISKEGVCSGMEPHK